MKYLNSKFWALPLSALMLTGCADLDTEPLGATVTETQKQETVAQNPARVSASVTGITALFSVFQASTTGHDDFGFPSLMLASDSRGTDMVCANIGYNWFRGQLLFTDKENSDDRVYCNWNTLYKQIFAANAVAKVVPAETTDPTLKYYRAQAVGIRAFDYFYLAQLYQLTYVGHEDKPCVPIITDKNADDAAVNGAPRATVSAVYEQILTDLNEAIALLEGTTVTRADKRYLSVAAAYGVRARVNLVMNKWAEAAADAQKAIDAAKAEGLAPATDEEVAAPGFVSLTEKNWVWGIKLAETDRVVTSGIVNWPSHMGSFGYGYASVGTWRRINKGLFESIPATDIRKGWFLDSENTSANITPAQKKYLDGKNVVPYTQVKFAPYKGVLGTDVNAQDIPLMRVEEFYLILAEAQAMGGDAAKGKQTLETFVKTYRNPSYQSQAASAAEVQEAVWMQRRIELWGEGHSYFDLLRLKKGIDRRGGGFEATAVFNIPADSYLTVYPLPKEEINGNPMISDTDNNPSEATPKPVTDN